MNAMNAMTPIPEIIEELRAGRLVVVVDDEDRENEGDLIGAAEHVTREQMAFIIRNTGGMVCLAMSHAKADTLDLPPMVARNTSARRTAFCVTIEAAQGVSTGISAADRVQTVRTAVKADCKPLELARPGHVLTLRAEDGGVLVRAGHTEAAVDLCRLAGLTPMGVLSELMNDDGTMMRGPALFEFCRAHRLKITSAAHLIEFRRRRETLVSHDTTVTLPTAFGTFAAHLFKTSVGSEEHMAFTVGLGEALPEHGFPKIEDPVLVRVHSECLTGDVFASKRCDCGAQLQLALRMVQAQGRGAVLYMRHHEGRGIGLAMKMRAYHLQERDGLDTVEANERLGFKADHRDYGIGAQILRLLGIRRLRLLTNNPRKFTGLRGYNLEIVERVPLQAPLEPENAVYMRTKRDKLGHWLENV